MNDLKCKIDKRRRRRKSKRNLRKIQNENKHLVLEKMKEEEERVERWQKSKEAELNKRIEVVYLVMLKV